MAKRKTPENDNTTPEAIAPVSVTETDSPKAKETMLEVPQGYVLIVGLNEDGSEKENSGFFYPEKSYQRIYGDETKFKVKKKSTLITDKYYYHETLYRTSQQITLTTHRRCNSCGG